MSICDRVRVLNFPEDRRGDADLVRQNPDVIEAYLKSEDAAA